MASIGVAGGGIIGCAVAATLAERGHAVTLFEPDLAGLPASAGNAGILAVPEVDPIARPDMLTQVPRWLIDPLGPLTLRWRDLPALSPWLAAFLRSASPARAASTRTALISLMRRIEGDHRALSGLAGIVDPLRATGALTLYDREASLDTAFRHESRTAEELNFSIERLSAAEVRARIPALDGAFAGGIVSSGYQTFRHPTTYLRALQAHVGREASIIEQAVTAVRPEGRGVALTGSDGTAHRFDKVVIAAGVWSRGLLRGLGLDVLLETERGYNTTYETPPFTLPMPIFFADHGFVASPFEGALRIGGAVELARPEAPANFARARAMRTKMRRYVSALTDEGGIEWMGRRPSTPDSLPVISLSPTDPRIAMAFGHGHLGLTLSATTGRLIADLIDGNDPDTARGLAPFSIRRFQRG
ncbi:NAD(P)/FAD-dependent oxidoreductase [Rhizobium sp. YIM 134829]|uniref:NAD(P)/FAD-dependent oxidoreductase n=1 Tax=Rhizobium sp. YIM 134829 TaxID=3390453 RepID=UPI003979914B